MIQKIFSNGRKGDNRQILIIIDDTHIAFYYNEHYENQKRWIRDEEERRLELYDEPLSDEDKMNCEFYWIDKDRWVEDKIQHLDRHDNFHTHMNEKNWFTSEMAVFINNNTKEK